MKHLAACIAAFSSVAACQAAPLRAGPAPVAAPPPCAPASPAEVSATIRAFYAALARDDDAALRNLITPDFYAFEVGRRFTGPELAATIADAHKAGRILQWNIGSVDSRIGCNLAFAAWENRGASGTAAKLEPRSWLESALLVRQGGGWALAMLHSTPRDPRH